MNKQQAYRLGVASDVEKLMRSGGWRSVEETLKEHYGVPVDYLTIFGSGVDNWLKMDPSSTSINL
jgi:hypothetical protein